LLLLRCPEGRRRSVQILEGPKLKGIFTIVRQRLEILPGNLVESQAIFCLADAMRQGPCIGKTINAQEGDA
jgi:hypothetical protein